jgi:hypothetical protein
MMGMDEEKQNQFMYVNLDDLVPNDHLLRSVQENM